MLEDIAAIATIITLGIYIFIEWPKIQRRWKKAYPVFEKFLMLVSIILDLAGLTFLVLSMFSKGPILFLYLSGGFASVGSSFLIGYWILNRTFFYRKSAYMSPIWIYIVAMFFTGALGIFFYWLGLL